MAKPAQNSTERQNIIFVGGRTHSGKTLAETIYPLVGGRMTVSSRPVPGEMEDFNVEGIREGVKYSTLVETVNGFYAARGYMPSSGFNSDQGEYCFTKPGENKSRTVTISIFESRKRLVGTVESV